MNDILKNYKDRYSARKIETLSLEEYLKLLKKDTSICATAAERMLKAIGQPEIIDTKKDDRLSRIFGNRVIRRYKVFNDFYGLEPVIERIVGYFKHAAQGLEESRQILYFLGPVGSAKSSLADRLKQLMEKEPIYVLADNDGNISPVRETPLGLFSEEDSKELGVSPRYLATRLSPWAIKRLEEYEGDITQFKVVKLSPSQDKQIGICVTEPGDENNQDDSSLRGKLDIRKLEFFAQNDPDAYSYSGGLCLANQGMLEFVEMFKAPIKLLHPLLEATQSQRYAGNESVGSIPFNGLIVAHSNETEWDQFKTNKANEAFLDRIYIVEVPYCLRINEEVLIYDKLLKTSDLVTAACAPNTLEMLAEFCILTRLTSPENSSLVSKMKSYNGENVKDKDNRAKTVQEYRDGAGRDEGFFGISTRLAYKILAEVYNFDQDEVAADPVHMLYVLDKTIQSERLSDELETKYLRIVKEYLTEDYIEKISKDIQTAYLDSYDDFGQNLFNRYIVYADYWIMDEDYRDSDTGQMFDREALNQELEKIEKPAEIANPKDFRNEIVRFYHRYNAKHKSPLKWNSNAKIKRVIEANMFTNIEDLLPVLSFSGHKSKDIEKKHKTYVSNMEKLGYTKKQIERIGQWYLRVRNS